jgi:hypothetical protein
MNLGIALNGGALRCSYYVGFFQYLYDYNIEVDEISAISSGVIAGLIYFSKENPKKVFDKFGKELEKYKFKPKVFSIMLDMFLKEYYLEKEKLEIINKKLKVLTTKLPKFEPIIFDQFSDLDDLFRITSSSCSLPFFFNFPVINNNEYYIDGGFARQDLTNYLNTNKKIQLSPFCIKKNKKNESIINLGIEDKNTFKDLYYSFFYNADISNKWFENGYQDAENTFKNSTSLKL